MNGELSDDVVGVPLDVRGREPQDHRTAVGQRVLT
jgi:hypothetical protein